MSLFCCFIDYSKAFDTVWRDALWHKLLKIGIEGKFLNLVINISVHILQLIS
uniref:Reverse transcriptase domain-containing protein n=1 Tax=Gadus morhua TaxID=8049 RepID=A0A8C5FEN0_GADMO